MRDGLAIVDCGVERYTPCCNASRTAMTGIGGMTRIVGEVGPSIVLLRRISRYAGQDLKVSRTGRLTGLTNCPCCCFFGRGSLRANNTCKTTVLSSFCVDRVIGRRLPGMVSKLAVANDGILNATGVGFGRTAVCLTIARLSIARTRGSERFPVVLGRLSLGKRTPIVMTNSFGSGPSGSVVGGLSRTKFVEAGASPVGFAVPSGTPGQRLSCVTCGPRGRFDIVSRAIFANVGTSSRLPVMSMLGMSGPWRE